MVLNIATELDKTDACLERFAVWQAAAFCACCAERLLPNYVSFSHEVGWGEPEQLRAILNYCWHVVEVGAQEKGGIEERMRACDSLAPDTEEFHVAGASMALDAVVAVKCALQCLADGTNRWAEIAARSALDTVDLYLRGVAFDQRVEDEGDFINGHPLMQGELSEQKRAIEDLGRLRAPSSKLLGEIRQRCVPSERPTHLP